MNIKLPILSLALLCGMATANATLYQFTNALGDGDTSNVANYVVLNEGKANYVWNLPLLFPENYNKEDMSASDSDGVHTLVNTYKAATSLPTASDTIYFSTYKIAEADADGNPIRNDNGTKKYTELPSSKNRTIKFLNSTTTGTFFQRGVQTIKLGSADSTDEKFTLSLTRYAVGYTSNCSIDKDENAAQSYFEINTTGDFESTNGTLRIGNVGTENYIDKLSVGGTLKIKGSTKVTSYAKEIDAGSISIEKSAIFNIFFAENIFTSKDAIVVIDKDFKIADDSTIQNINLDFSALDFSEVKAGDKFDLISAGNVTGFDINDTSVNFTYDGVSASLEPELGAELVWNNDNVLQLVITGNVPEPSTVALIFGAVAIAFVAMRRRK